MKFQHFIIQKFSLTYILLSVICSSHSATLAPLAHACPLAPCSPCLHAFILVLEWYQIVGDCLKMDIFKYSCQAVMQICPRLFGYEGFLGSKPLTVSGLVFLTLGLILASYQNFGPSFQCQPHDSKLRTSVLDSKCWKNFSFIDFNDTPTGYEKLIIDSNKFKLFPYLLVVGGILVILPHWSWIKVSGKKNFLFLSYNSYHFNI